MNRTKLHQEIAEKAKADGISILPNLLSEDELEAVRADFEQFYEDQGRLPQEPGTRIGIETDSLIDYPSIAMLFAQPDILAIVKAILEEPRPFLRTIKTNRYTPEHSGVDKHTDCIEEELSPPHQIQSVAVFLDDIRVESGALTYVPGSHRRYYESEDNPDGTLPSKKDIEAGDYIPAELNAGSVLFRVPEVWHAVNPIHHLRRYITFNYLIRLSLAPKLQETCDQAVESRKQSEQTIRSRALQEMWLL